MDNIIEFQYFDNPIAQNFASSSKLEAGIPQTNDFVKMQIALYLAQAKEDGCTTLIGLHQLAKLIGVENSERITLKRELIRAIQRAAHNVPCFRTERSIFCTEENCKWRTECKKLVAEWYR
ncbi:conserved hypothetical protein [Crenothrix polyspora]|uniref:Uncharacterized protein n=1 Tax=Crenothrix polyspora TaxID=360316 RepID=A0A1R4H1D3_9GAMM|nr:hypothetical protein [Crenothrix polyspora]SJM90012.1 conserved hypothetical protein [Crenothrix polyspora]